MGKRKEEKLRPPRMTLSAEQRDNRNNPSLKLCTKGAKKNLRTREAEIDGLWTKNQKRESKGNRKLILPAYIGKE